MSRLNSMWNDLLETFSSFVKKILGQRKHGIKAGKIRSFLAAPPVYDHIRYVEVKRQIRMPAVQPRQKFNSWFTHNRFRESKKIQEKV